MNGPANATQPAEVADALQDDEGAARPPRHRRAGLRRAAEGALRDGPVEASDQVDGIELSGISRWPRRTAEAQRDFCAGRAADHADDPSVGQSAGLGSVDGDEDVARSDLSHEAG